MTTHAYLTESGELSRGVSCDGFSRKPGEEYSNDGVDMWRRFFRRWRKNSRPIRVKHGFKDAANAFFLSILRPRVHLVSVYAASQPGPDVMRRVLSERIYAGPRDLFLTSGVWEGRRPHMVNLFGEEETAWLIDRIEAAAASRGHIVVRVDPGGETYRVFVLEDRDESRTVLFVHGPYRAGMPVR